MSFWSPHAKYRHVFAVVRIDSPENEAADIASRVTITKILWTEAEAKAEVERLMEINADKGALYFWTITRLTPPPNSTVDRTGDPLLV